MRDVRQPHRTASREKRRDGLPSVGVEEELQIVHSHSGQLQASAKTILDETRNSVGSAELVHELRLSQVEAVTPICHSLAEVRRQINLMRGALAESAARNEAAVLAAGTHPFSDWADQPFTPKRRYHDLAAVYQQLAHEQVIFGLHVHVGIADPEQAVGVLNRLRPWLPVILALSANSPYWMGRDTGYASYRTEVWSRWPMSGPPHCFTSFEQYESVCRQLVECGAVDDVTKIYWDARIPFKLPTLEVRVADACTRVEDVVMLTGLIRGLAARCEQEVAEGAVHENPRQEVIRAAQWNAARYGLQRKLIDCLERRERSAAELVQRLLRYIAPAMDATDHEAIAAWAENTLMHGNGAERQREVFQQQGSLQAVVEYLLEASRPESDPPVR